MIFGTAEESPRKISKRWLQAEVVGKMTNEKSDVLVVEDETEIRELIELHLKREGLRTDTASSAEEAWNLLKNNGYTLAILDWMLPGLSGLEVAKYLRRDPSASNMSILMVTAKSEPEDIIAGLESGADDYVTKPFDPAVLMARVRALLRRARRTQAAETEGEFQVVRVGQLKLYPEKHEVKCGDQPIHLTRSEFRLLLALANSRGRVLTRDSLISHVQGEGVAVVGRTVDTHVFGLRKKLGECADVIETVRGIGYRVRSVDEN